MCVFVYMENLWEFRYVHKTHFRCIISVVRWSLEQAFLHMYWGGFMLPWQICALGVAPAVVSYQTEF